MLCLKSISWLFVCFIRFMHLCGSTEYSTDTPNVLCSTLVFQLTVLYCYSDIFVYVVSIWYSMLVYGFTSLYLESDIFYMSNVDRCNNELHNCVDPRNCSCVWLFSSEIGLNRITQAKNCTQSVGRHRHEPHTQKYRCSDAIPCKCSQITQCKLLLHLMTYHPV